MESNARQPSALSAPGSTVRIALAAVAVPRSLDDSIERATNAIAEAGARGASVVCFPEAYVPGYRTKAAPGPAPDAAALERAWRAIGAASKTAGIAVVLGTEHVTPRGLQIAARVFDRDGAHVGTQVKVQLDPTEDDLYVAGEGRSVFTIGALTFGVAICHEGWRYPETVRWAVRRGAHLVFHPHYHWAEEGSFRPTSFADPRNTFHEKALLCRAAENTCFIASVNYASDGAPTTAAVVRPDGTLMAFHPYGEEGVLVVDIPTDEATGLLATRLRTSPL